MEKIVRTLMDSFLPLFLLLVFLLGSTLFLDNKAEELVKSYEEIQLMPFDVDVNLEKISSEGEVVLEISNLADSTANHPAISKARELTKTGDLVGAENLLKETLLSRRQYAKGKSSSDDANASLRLQLGVTLMRLNKLQKAEGLFNKMIQNNSISELVYFNRALLRTRLEKFTEAAEDYHKALQLKPTHFESMYNLGLLQIQQGNPQEAQKSMSRACELASGKPRAKAYFALGLVWTMLENTDEAKRSYLMAIDVKPDYLLPRYNLALLGIAQADAQGLKEARDYLDRIEALQPNYAPEKFLRGRLASRIGDNVAAIDWYQKAARLDPDFYKARYNMGIVALRLGRFNLAHSVFTRLKEDFPNRPQPEFNLGKLAYQRRQYEQALKHYQRALEIGAGNYEVARSNIGLVMLALGRLDEALAVFDNMRAKDKNNASAWLNRGLVLMRKEQLKLAEESLQRAIAIKPNLVSAFYNLGKLDAKKEQYDKAQKAYAKVLELQPKHLKAAVNRGVMLGKLDRLDDAIAAYQVAINIVPTHVPAHYNLALSLRKQKRFNEAKKVYETILDLDGEHTGALLNLGVVYAKLGEYEKAAQLFDKSLDYEPGNYKTRFNLALQLKKMNRTDEAQVEFEKVLQLYNNHLGATRNLAQLLYKQGKLEQAVLMSERAVEIKSDNKTKAMLKRYQNAYNKKL